jgi:hypothetical protein
MATLDEITKEKQRVSEALARIDAQREKLVGQLSELEAARGCARALQQGHEANKEGCSQGAGNSNEDDSAGAIAWAQPHKCCKNNWPQARFVELGRSGPCVGNRQDATGNHRCMQRRSPQPCRRRHCPAQASWPYRRARWQALRRWRAATRRGLTAKRASTDPDRSRPTSLRDHDVMQRRGISDCSATSSGTVKQPIPIRRSGCRAALGELLVLPPNDLPGEVIDGKPQWSRRRLLIFSSRMGFWMNTARHPRQIRSGSDCRAAQHRR